MISPGEIKIKAGKKYLNYLQALVKAETFFPLVIRGDKKPSKSIVDFQNEITTLVSKSKERRGYGYHIEYKTTKTKTIGTQSLPECIRFDTEADYLKFLKKEKEVEAFKANINLILNEVPELYEWVFKNPPKVIKNSSFWVDILKVVQYFKRYPQPNLYIRELPIKVHTKFIESNKGTIKELLDVVIESYVNKAETDFEKRFNLKCSEPLVRFKILDQSISKKYFNNIDDLSIPLSQFQNLRIPLKKVLIVENKTSLYTTLTLPKMEEAIAIFGRGYGVSNLKKASWLNDADLLYWEDIDAQGFEILSQLRGYFPHAKSILMDNATFEKFFEEDSGSPSLVSTNLHLNDEENALYQTINENNWRLEQEKIPFDYVNNMFIDTYISIFKFHVLKM